MPMRRKKFVLALQPHEASPTHRIWSPEMEQHTLSFCVALLILMGLAFPMTTPDAWKEQVRVGLLRISYGWQATPLLASSEASSLYTQWFSKAPKSGCSDAPEQDWKVVCPLIGSQMTTTGENALDCEHVNLQSKADILRNFEQSKTTFQYACLYGG